MNYVIYRRVSTQRQGRSGLGLEAQQETIDRFITENRGTIIATYTEVESGTNDHRPELLKALGHTKRSRAILLVAKLDRLSRSLAFTSSLMESGVEFVCCDFPQANRLTIHILAAVAEYEAKLISNRTKDAMAAAKRRGAVFGSARPGHWDGKEESRRKGHELGRERAAKKNKQLADAIYNDILPFMVELRESKGYTLQQIADHLNNTGQSTRNNASWTRCQVSRVLQRA